jgi:NAD(P)-dependent dehydrogenase (short-subunit alcohol dehydrogenase family)
MGKEAFTTEELGPGLRRQPEEHVPDLRAGAPAYGAAWEGSDRQHRLRLSVSGIRWLGVPYISYAATKAAGHSAVHPGRSAIRPVGHPRELDPAGNDEHPMVDADEVIATYGGSAEEMVRRRDAQCAMGRMCDAWDVAYGALFLASDEAKYITGTELVVDGGLTVNCV